MQVSAYPNSGQREDHGDSRVWGGIHWRTADEVGACTGKRVGNWESSHYFKLIS